MSFVRSYLLPHTLNSPKIYNRYLKRQPAGGTAELFGFEAPAQAALADVVAARSCHLVKDKVCSCTKRQQKILDLTCYTYWLEH